MGTVPAYNTRKKVSFPFSMGTTWKAKTTLALTMLCMLPTGHAGPKKSESGDGDATCEREEEGDCFNKATAQKLKIAAIFAIFCCSLLGVAIPLLGRGWRFLRPNGKALFVAKAFGAGVILATGCIHMLPEAIEKLESECLPEEPWHKFPWGTFFAMLTILVMSMIEFAATSFYEAQAEKRARDNPKAVAGAAMASAAVKDVAGDVEKNTRYQNQEAGEWRGIHGHSHGLPAEMEEEGSKRIRNTVVAQVLEFGIASHSVLIGLALGVSFSPCEIRPVFAALVFHQFFEGIALGGCITQAGFGRVSSTCMALIFATTTPIGIAVGLGIYSSYNSNSVTALLTEGILHSISAGILIYMALVNLIATELFGKRLRKDRLLQLMTFPALFLGTAALSIIGIWA